MGIALSVVPKSEVVPKSLELAEQIASASPIAVQATLRTLRAQVDEGLFRALQREADSQAHCYAHKDLKEGLASVREKRNPKF
jgi:enoyl-CoA hydratase